MTVDIDVRVSGWRDDLERLDKRLDALERRDVAVDVDVRTDESQLDALDDRLDNIGGELDNDIEIGVDDDQLADIEDRAENLSGGSAEFETTEHTTYSSNLDERADAIEERLDEIGRDRYPDYSPDVQDRASAEVKRRLEQLEEPRTVRIDPELAVRELAQIERQLDEVARDRTAVIRYREEGDDDKDIGSGDTTDIQKSFSIGDIADRLDSATEDREARIDPVLQRERVNQIEQDIREGMVEDVDTEKVRRVSYTDDTEEADIPESERREREYQAEETIDTSTSGEEYSIEERLDAIARDRDVTFNPELDTADLAAVDRAIQRAARDRKFHFVREETRITNYQHSGTSPGSFDDVEKEQTRTVNYETNIDEEDYVNAARRLRGLSVDRTVDIEPNVDMRSVAEADRKLSAATYDRFSEYTINEVHTTEHRERGKPAASFDTTNKEQTRTVEYETEFDGDKFVRAAQKLRGLQEGRDVQIGVNVLAEELASAEASLNRVARDRTANIHLEADDINPDINVPSGSSDGFSVSDAASSDGGEISKRLGPDGDGTLPDRIKEIDKPDPDKFDPVRPKREMQAVVQNPPDDFSMSEIVERLGGDSDQATYDMGGGRAAATFETDKLFVDSLESRGMFDGRFKDPTVNVQGREAENREDVFRKLDKRIPERSSKEPAYQNFNRPEPEEMRDLFDVFDPDRARKERAGRIVSSHFDATGGEVDGGMLGRDEETGDRVLRRVEDDRVKDINLETREVRVMRTKDDDGNPVKSLDDIDLQLLDGDDAAESIAESFEGRDVDDVVSEARKRHIDNAPNQRERLRRYVEFELAESDFDFEEWFDMESLDLDKGFEDNLNFGEDATSYKDRDSSLFNIPDLDELRDIDLTGDGDGLFGRDKDRSWGMSALRAGSSAMEVVASAAEIAESATDSMVSSMGTMAQKASKVAANMQIWYKLLAALMPMLIAAGVQAAGVATAFGGAGIAGGLLLGGGLLGEGANMEEAVQNAQEDMQGLQEDLFNEFQPTFSAFAPIQTDVFQEVVQESTALSQEMRDLTVYADLLMGGVEGFMNFLTRGMQILENYEPIISQLTSRFGDMAIDFTLEGLRWLLEEAYKKQDMLVQMAVAFIQLGEVLYDIANLVAIFGTALNPLWHALSIIVKLLTDVLGMFAPLVAGIIQGVLAIWGLVKGAGVLLTIFGAIKTVVMAIATVIGTVIGGTFAPIILAVTLLVAALWTLWEVLGDAPDLGGLLPDFDPFGFGGDGKGDDMSGWFSGMGMGGEPRGPKGDSGSESMPDRERSKSQQTSSTTINVYGQPDEETMQQFRDVADEESRKNDDIDKVRDREAKGYSTRGNNSR